MERLEERAMLAFQSPPVWGLPVAGSPVDVAVGPVDRDAWEDLVSLAEDGRLTVARNGGDGSWNSTVASDLGLVEPVTAHGLTLGLLDGDSLLDAVIQHSDGITVARGDGSGSFVPQWTWRAGSSGSLAPADGGRVGLAATLVNEDFFTDLIAVSPSGDEVLVFWGRGPGDAAGPLQSPVRYASGGREPVDVVVGQFVGDALPDVAVGHRDGTMTVLEGLPGGTFQLQSAATVGGLGTIQDLAAGDLDEDGDLDLAVSGGDHVTVLWQDDDGLSAGPIVNGDFGNSLTGWTTEVSSPGSTDGAAVPGAVNALGGFAQLWEHDSFLTSLQQTFTVPPSPQTISFDVVALGLESAAGGIPDAFEASLLDDAGRSLVPAFRPEATSFFNVAADDVEGADGNDGSYGKYEAGVSWDGRRVTLDIASLEPGTRATLVFDLLGNPPGYGSVVGIDNVRIEPDTLPRDTFTPSVLPGTFQSSAGIAAGDVDGDGHLDLVVADAAADRVMVLGGDGRGAFVRDELDVSRHGHRPQAVALGLLTPQDSAWDAAIGLAHSDCVLTPLAFDPIPPEVVLIQPAPGQTTMSAVTQIELLFSEPMRDAGPAGEHSVANPAAYRLYTAGENGVFEAGGGDDVLFAWDRIDYDSAAYTVTLWPAAGALADERYEFRVLGGDSASAPADLTGNVLAGGSDAVFSFAVNAAGPVDLQAADLAGSEGQTVTLLATFANPGSSGPHTAVVDWGDGNWQAAVVFGFEKTGTGTDRPDRSQSQKTGTGTDRPDRSQSPFSVTADHVYADNGRYTVRIEITDESLLDYGSYGTDGSYVSLELAAVIENVPPALTVSAAPVRYLGLDVTLDVGTFTDAGFSSAVAGTEETFSATIDWGDGTGASAGVVSVVPGAVGIPTSGTIQGSHTYAASGTYAVTVSVADDDGGRDEQTLTLEVRPLQSVQFFVVDHWDWAVYRYTSQFAADGMWQLACCNLLPRAPRRTRPATRCGWWGSPAACSFMMPPARCEVRGRPATGFWRRALPPTVSTSGSSTRCRTACTFMPAPRPCGVAGSRRPVPSGWTRPISILRA